jgi:hypothetical protein
MMTSVAPTTSIFQRRAIAVRCAKGVVTMIRSSPRSPYWIVFIHATCKRLAWVVIAPFGRPEVPEV